MELFDKAPALSRIDVRDVFAIADAHGVGGWGGLGRAAGETGLGAEDAPGR